jgi:protein SCO1
MRCSVLIFVVLLAGCQAKEAASLPYYDTPDFTPRWEKEDVPVSKAHTIAPFSFTNQEGKEVTNKTVKGKIYVANFFFTTCGSICPKMTVQLKKVAAAFQADTNVLLLSHTVLPETDNVARLAAYATAREIPSGKWNLLTGDKESLYKMARQSYFAEATEGVARAADEFLHTENCVLVDREGRIRGVYNATLSLEMEKLMEDIRTLLVHD